MHVVGICGCQLLHLGSVISPADSGGNIYSTHQSFSHLPECWGFSLCQYIPVLTLCQHQDSGQARPGSKPTACQGKGTWSFRNTEWQGFCGDPVPLPTLLFLWGCGQSCGKSSALSGPLGDHAIIVKTYSNSFKALLASSVTWEAI